MTAADVREKRKRTERLSGARVRESRLTIALAALKLAAAQSSLVKSRRLKK